MIYFKACPTCRGDVEWVEYNTRSTALEMGTRGLRCLQCSWEKLAHGTIQWEKVETLLHEHTPEGFEERQEAQKAATQRYKKGMARASAG